MKKLPKRVSIDKIPDELCDYINDYLSDKYGYCTNSWCWTLTITDIDWDKED